MTRIMASADIDDDVEVGEGTTVWHLAHLRQGARIGKNCVLGRGCYVGPGVRVGDNVKIQNYALVYEPAIVEDGAFIGPAAVLTNDVYPRAVTAGGDLKSELDWTAAGVIVRKGASVGARAVIVAGVTVGRWSIVGAGAVVTRDVPDFALVTGVPARRTKWVGRAGVPLVADASGGWTCPDEGVRYTEQDGVLREAQ